MKPNAIPAEILTRFRSRAFERLARIEAAWAALLQGEESAELAATVARELHTLKGDSRLVGYSDISVVCHKLEELMTAASRKCFRVPEDFDLLATMAFRFIDVLLHAREGGTFAGINVEGFIVQIDGVLAEDREGPAAIAEGTATTSSPAHVRSSAYPRGLDDASLDRISPATQRRLAVAATSVFLEHLGQAGRARERLREVWLSLSAEISASYAVELESTLARHREAVLDLAKDLGKQVSASIDACDVWVRKDVALAIDTAVLHLVRNAVDHGIEDKETRQREGKPTAGRIAISARALADAVEVTVEDDGRGVDLDAVRGRGIERGLLQKENSGAASDEALLSLVLEPGFTTATRISDISGRGIGLDAVRAALARTGGSISLTSRRGQGTTAIVRVPPVSRRMAVTSFRAARPGADFLLAVSTDWSASITTGLCDSLIVDPLVALEIDERPLTKGAGEGESERVFTRLCKGEQEIILLTGSAPVAESVERFCPTGDEHPVEVVRLRGALALLLRPELLVAACQR